MKRLIAFVIAFCICRAAGAQRYAADTAYTIIPAPQHTWGYDITAGNKIFIHQATVPGMPGEKGFASKTDAARVARLVLQKLHNGVMPPSVTAEELKKLHLNLKNR